MPRAIFKTSIGKVAKIDLENGVVYGCKLALNSVVSTAAEDCGKGIVTNDAMMLKFVELCQGKQVDAFFTHDRFEDASDPIHYDIGFWDNVRRDESGNLIGDLHLCPSEFKDRILWAAENNPGGIMVSPVFEYAEDSEPDKVVPDSVISFDIVKKGAVTSGLFSADNNNNKLTALQ